MGTMLGYRCVDCDNLKITYEGIGMSGQEARSLEKFECPGCSTALLVDGKEFDWQWTLIWCGTCHHAFIPLFADYYPGMTFEQAARAHSAQFPVNVTTSDSPAESPLYRRFREMLGPTTDDSDRNGIDHSVIDIDAILQEANSQAHTPRILRGQLTGLRPCKKCNGDTFEDLGKFGFWD